MPIFGHLRACLQQTQCLLALTACLTRGLEGASAGARAAVAPISLLPPAPATAVEGETANGVAVVEVVADLDESPPATAVCGASCW